jgi:hypothetical protein
MAGFSWENKKKVQGKGFEPMITGYILRGGY